MTEDLMVCDRRLQRLEKKILIEAGGTPSVVYEMKKQVDLFREKLEVWLNYFWDVAYWEIYGRKKDKNELKQITVIFQYTNNSAWTNSQMKIMFYDSTLCCLIITPSLTPNLKRCEMESP